MGEHRDHDHVDALLRQAMFELADTAEPVPDFADLGTTVTTPLRQESDDMSPRKWIFAAAAALVAIVGTTAVVLALTDDEETTAAVVGEVTMEVDLEELKGDLGTGTFTVTDGVAVLGCASGTFVDTDARYPNDEPVGNQPTVTREFTCTVGDNRDTFTTEWTVDEGNADPDAPFVWTVVGGTGAHADLEGDGEWSFDESGPAVIEIWQGRLTNQGR